MTGKEALELISEFEDDIEKQKLYIQELKSALTGLTAIQYDKDRVQSSPSSDPMLDKLVKIEDEEKKLNQLIERLARHKVYCVNLIKDVKDITLQKILYLVFIEKNSLKETARKINYTYDYVKKLYRKALQEV